MRAVVCFFYPNSCDLSSFPFRPSLNRLKQFSGSFQRKRQYSFWPPRFGGYNGFVTISTLAPPRCSRRACPSMLGIFKTQVTYARIIHNGVYRFIKTRFPVALGSLRIPKSFLVFNICIFYISVQRSMFNVVPLSCSISQTGPICMLLVKQMNFYPKYKPEFK